MFSYILFDLDGTRDPKAWNHRQRAYMRCMRLVLKSLVCDRLEPFIASSAATAFRNITI